MNIRLCVAAVLVASSAGAASAAIDSITPAQQALGAFSVQNTQSSFGGNNVLAAAYASISGGNLDLLVTGRINTGNERFVIFVDNLGGGGAATLPSGLFGFGGGATGLTFDAGFRPQTAIVANGNAGGIFVDFNGNIGGTPASTFVGGQARSNDALALGGGSGSPDIRASFNDSFSGGEFGFGALSPAAASAYAAATTGMGLRVPLAALGINSDEASFLVSVAILGGDGSTISSQWLGGVGGFGGAINGGGNGFNNYPGLGSVDLTLVPGNQFFRVPTPGAAAVLGLGGVALLRRRR